MKSTSHILLAALLLLAVGCSKHSTSGTATTADGSKVALSSKGDQVNFDVTTKSGQKTSLKSSASGMALPDDFPKDVPIPPKGTIQVFNQLGKTQTQVGVMNAATVADLTTFYETELKKQEWTDASTMKMGEGAMISAKKGARGCMITITPQDPKNTYVQLVLSTPGN